MLNKFEQCCIIFVCLFIAIMYIDVALSIWIGAFIVLPIIDRLIGDIDINDLQINSEQINDDMIRNVILSLTITTASICTVYHIIHIIFYQ